ncbi:Thymidine kinase [uncultured archaeon]|nr:Thymidine kinase [uncultured archaeon]
MMDGKSGSIIAITGPMFSGKTSRLIEFLEREARSGKKIILFKPDIDKRYDEKMVVTHKGIKLQAAVIGTSRAGIAQIEKDSAGFDVVGIDEVELWGEGEFMAKALDRLAFAGKIVYVSMLNRDHTGAPFKGTVEPLARADAIHSLTSICCKCGGEATFSQRVREGKEVFGDLIMVGGNDSYEPRCRACFVRQNSGVD